VVEFRDIVRQQIEEDMQTRVGDTIKKELTSQIGEVQQTVNTHSFYSPNKKW